MSNMSNAKILWPKFIMNLAREVPADPLTKALLVTFVELALEEENNLDQKIALLVASHYKMGSAYLNDAKKSTDGSMREDWMKKALHEFMTASYVESPLIAAKSQFFVGACYDLLRQSGLALTWYENAYGSGSKLMRKVLLESVPSTVEALLVVTLDPFLKYRPRQLRKAEEELLNILPFLMPLSQLLTLRNSSFHALQVQDIMLMRKSIRDVDLAYGEYIKGIESKAPRALPQEVVEHLVQEPYHRCSRCQGPVRAGTKFCGSCGSPIATCPECQNPVLAGDIFCAICGAPLSPRSTGKLTEG